jgi:hypothetical protein
LGGAIGLNRIELLGKSDLMQRLVPIGRTDDLLLVNIPVRIAIKQRIHFTASGKTLDILRLMY